MKDKEETWSAEDEETFVHRLIGYEVLDKDGNKAGVVDAVFEDQENRPEFFGIRIGVLGFSRMHLVPAQFAEIDEHERRIRLPFDTGVMEHAPAFDADFEVTDEAEKQVFDYYRDRGFSPGEYGLREKV